MTTLASDAPRAFYQGVFLSFAVIASDIIYKGAAVGDNGAGYARPLVAGDKFRGFAERQADNSAGSAGAITVDVRTSGQIELSIASLAITDVGKPVYASDDDTFTLTQGSNSHIGRVVRWLESGRGIVEFDAARASIGQVAEVTDSTSGTVDGTLAAVSGSGADAEINNNFAELASKVNAIARQIG